MADTQVCPYSEIDTIDTIAFVIFKLWSLITIVYRIVGFLLIRFPQPNL